MANAPRLRDRLLLYLVLDPDHVSRDPLEVAAAAIHGGVTTLQIRCKTKSDRYILELARGLRGLTAENGVLFIVNDRIDIALASDADGVHLGVDDLPLDVTRAIGGKSFVIGYSPESDEQAKSAAARGADYLGVGPVFGTVTKFDAGSPIGLEVLAARADLAGIPIVGIGGVTAANAIQVVEHGACGVAVVSAIAEAPDARAAARQFRDALGW